MARRILLFTSPERDGPAKPGLALLNENGVCIAAYSKVAAHALGAVLKTQREAIFTPPLVETRPLTYCHLREHVALHHETDPRETYWDGRAYIIGRGENAEDLRANMDERLCNIYFAIGGPTGFEPTPKHASAFFVLEPKR